MIESNFDSIAQQSAFRHIHPGTKLFLGLGALILCLISPSPVPPLISGIVISLVLLIPGRLSPRIYGHILLGPAIFVCMSIIILLLMLGGKEVIWQFHPVSGITLSITREAVNTSFLILCRVFGCSVSLFFITLTTPMTDLFNVMKRMRIPIELIDMMMIVYRYIFIFYAIAVEIWQAQVMRLGYSRPRESIRSFSMLCGMLFITSWNAGEDLIHAMDCRCYNGVMPNLDQADPVRIPSILLVSGYLILLSGIIIATTQGIMVMA